MIDHSRSHPDRLDFLDHALVPCARVVWCTMSLVESGALSAYQGDFQALFGAFRRPLSLEHEVAALRALQRMFQQHGQDHRDWESSAPRVLGEEQPPSVAVLIEMRQAEAAYYDAMDREIEGRLSEPGREEIARRLVGAGGSVRTDL